MSRELLLIVEDNDKSRKLVRDVLAHRGNRTLESENAEEGIRLAREHRPALILMDIQLPGMNGVEALSHLRADPVTKDIPVLAVTASAMTQGRHKIMAAGFDAHQRKPLDIRAFLESVERTLGRRPAKGDEAP